MGQQRRPLRALLTVKCYRGKEQSYMISLTPGAQQNPKINEQRKANRGAENRAVGARGEGRGGGVRRGQPWGRAPETEVSAASTPQLRRRQKSTVVHVRCVGDQCHSS